MSAHTGYQSVFQRGDGASPEVFTAIANVVSITLPGRSREVVALDEIDQQFEKYIPGKLEESDISLSLNFDLQSGGNYSDYSNLLTDQKAESTHNYKILVKQPSDGSTLKTYSFAAIITNVEVTELKRGEKLMVNVTLKPAGGEVTIA